MSGAAGIIMKAIQIVVKSFGSSEAIGMQVGDTLALWLQRFVVTGGRGYLWHQNADGEKVELTLTEVQRLCVDEQGHVNTQNKGAVVGVICKGSNGHYYQYCNQKWFAWDGNDWIRVPD